jgi:hypothetical protein
MVKQPYDYSRVQEIQTPATGRLIREDGQAENVADLVSDLSNSVDKSEPFILLNTRGISKVTTVDVILGMQEKW